MWKEVTIRVKKLWLWQCLQACFRGQESHCPTLPQDTTKPQKKPDEELKDVYVSQ
jgi:hypothetical protein